FTNEEKLLFQAMATRAAAAILLAQLLDRERAARDEARRYQRQLEAEHRLLAGLVDQLPLGLAACEMPSRRMIFRNPAIEAILRMPWTPDAPASGDWPGFHLDGRPYKRDEWPLLRAIERGERIVGEE